MEAVTRGLGDGGRSSAESMAHLNGSDHANFREHFKEFAGTEKFRKFVEQLHRTKYRKTGLRYWQQELWNTFVATYPEYAMSTEDLSIALAICELHELQLEPVVVPVFRGCIDYAPDYIADMIKMFPHSTPDQILTEGGEHKIDPTIWICRECDNVRNRSKWRKR
jgi:hypothetical protein